MHRISRILTLALALPLALACDTKAPLEVGDTTLTGIVPAAGSVGANVEGKVVVSFSHAIMTGMERYAALHQGDVTGPVVNGTWELSSEGKQLRFTPAAALQPGTRYTVHLGAGMLDAEGHMVDMSTGQMMGGQSATGEMMSGGGMMPGNPGMMGPGWRVGDGGYGMLFTFTTG